MNPEAVLADLERAFAEAGARWYLFGAQAAILYGRPRLTQDIDVTVEFPLEKAAELRSLLARHHLEVRAGITEPFVQTTRTLPLEHLPSHTAVDLVFAGAGLESVFLDRARQLALGALEVPVISPEDLLITKILAGRPKDLEDVETVLRANENRLDLDHVRYWLDLLEQALDRRDLLSELTRLGERSRGRSAL